MGNLGEVDQILMVRFPVMIANSFPAKCYGC